MAEQNISLSKTEQILLDILGNALFHAGHVIGSHYDWNCVLREAYVQAVPRIVLSEIDSNMLDTELYSKIKRKTDQILANNIRVNREHANLHQRFVSAGIPYMILKGCASTAYYPDPMLRSMGDVDFLVLKSDIERAGRVLESEGFQAWGEKHICHIVYRKNMAHLEMHFEPSGIPYGRAGDLVREYLSDAIEMAIETDTEFGKMIMPSKFHHGLVLLLHTSHHLTGEGVGLRHLCDWAVFVDSLTDELFCELFEEKLKAIGMWKFAQILTQTAVHYLGCKEKKWVGKEEQEVTKAIILDIFAGGNFGKKDIERSNESRIISNRGKSGIGRTSMFRQLFLSLNEVVRTRWGISKKCPVLLPIGWIFFGVKYLIWIVMGKRKAIHPKKMIEGASARRDLYQKLQLFEI